MSLSINQFNAILDQINTTLGGLTITAAASAFTLKETNTVDFFHGTIDEDPTEWIEKFKRAKDANNWSDNRLRDIAGELMKDEAADWCQADKGNINHWSNTTNTPSQGFKQIFIT